MNSVGVEVQKDGRFVMGTHSLRRGGAQALAASGWPLSHIKSWARWRSEAVWVYIQDAYLKESWQEVAANIVGFYGTRKDVMEADSVDDQLQVVNGKPPVVGDVISFYSAQTSKWLRGIVKLTPHQSRPRSLASIAPVWPAGRTVCVVGFMSADPRQPSVDQVLALDRTTRWYFVGDVRSKKISARTTRPKKQ